MNKITVINSRQEEHPFMRKKIYNSCIRCGAPKDLTENIVRKIESQPREKLTTKEISELVKKELRKKSKKSFMKFSLKDAMRRLGPTGFNFEKYIAAIFMADNFKVKINQIIPGHCISSYEIDFLAEKNNYRYIGECKYHTFPGKRVDLKVALYNYARFLDIKRKSAIKDLKLKPMLVTNTKFTKKVIKYSECMNVHLLGWKYPLNHGLERLIDKSEMYPITILPSFKNIYKDIFAQARIMLVKQLLEKSPKYISEKTNLPIKQINQLIKESRILLE